MSRQPSDAMVVRVAAWLCMRDPAALTLAARTAVATTHGRRRNVRAFIARPTVPRAVPFGPGSGAGGAVQGQAVAPEGRSSGRTRHPRVEWRSPDDDQTR